MDLNYLYRRHQISLMRSESAGSRSAQIVHARLAQGYARLIEEQRILRQLPPAPRHSVSTVAGG